MSQYKVYSNKFRTKITWNLKKKKHDLFEIINLKSYDGYLMRKRFTKILLFNGNIIHYILLAIALN